MKTILEIISIRVLPEEKLKEILMKCYPRYDPVLKQWTPFHLETKRGSLLVRTNHRIIE